MIIAIVISSVLLALTCGYLYIQLQITKIDFNNKLDTSNRQIESFEKSRLQLFDFCQTIQKEMIGLKRALSQKQGEVYGSSFCTSCNALLPENTVKTHDGKLYCADCKAKHFEKIERKKLDG